MRKRKISNEALERELKKQYETYKKYYEKEVKRLAKFGLKPIKKLDTSDKEPKRGPVTYESFASEVMARRANTNSKYITRDIAREHTAPRTTAQEAQLLNNALIQNPDGTYSFNEKIFDLLMITDLVDKYTKVLNYKRVSDRNLSLVQMIKELGERLKVLGWTGNDIQENIGEAFYGS